MDKTNYGSKPYTRYNLNTLFLMKKVIMSNRCQHVGPTTK